MERWSSPYFKQEEWEIERETETERKEEKRGKQGILYRSDYSNFEFYIIILPKSIVWWIIIEPKRKKGGWNFPIMCEKGSTFLVVTNKPYHLAMRWQELIFFSFACLLLMCLTGPRFILWSARFHDSSAIKQFDACTRTDKHPQIQKMVAHTYMSTCITSHTYIYI